MKRPYCRLLKVYYFCKHRVSGLIQEIEFNFTKKGISVDLYNTQYMHLVQAVLVYCFYRSLVSRSTR